ncbi:hypothetical protein [Sphaerisporangium sp. TRM90804]|uniref:hypothetical protein n=1 Tax=Sphaerisporangium sp. TRM90804 TaxID=3031113 RepID=UPI002446CD27|nr:hypothetical protein [Sphaerisporangium sp. TRM90804]MDH2427723.1 hypothetical protein [Sphaerisporangium sp. TRM90804]
MPARIRLISGVTVAALVLLFATLAVITQGARTGLRAIGHDAGPQVVATAGLYLALSDMDGQVALLLLMGGGRDERRAEALLRYERSRTEAGRALLRASALAGDDAREGRTVQAVLDGLGRYERTAARALLLAEQAGYDAGPPPERVLRTYRAATDLMREELLPQAYNLTLESGTTVRRVHDETRSSLTTGRAVVAAAGVLALGCLVALQVYLARRFRRLFGPALVLASAVTAMYVLTGLHVSAREADALVAAKRDGFDAVLLLARARAIGNGMHADQTRYLLDPERADTYEHTYLDAAQSVLYLEATSVHAYHERVAAAAAAPEGGRRPAFAGFLGSALAMRDASGTRPVLAAYDRLQRSDADLRRRASGGETGQALSVLLGPLTSDFDRYDATLLDLAGQHRTSFERSIARGEDALADLWFLLPVAMVSIAVLVVAGIWPRLDEYR